MIDPRVMPTTPTSARVGFVCNGNRQSADYKQRSDNTIPALHDNLTDKRQS
jgi:hypothetical protein